MGPLPPSQLCPATQKLPRGPAGSRLLIPPPPSMIHPPVCPPPPGISHTHTRGEAMGLTPESHSHLRHLCITNEWTHLGATGFCWLDSVSVGTQCQTQHSPWCQEPCPQSPAYSPPPHLPATVATFQSSSIRVSVQPLSSLCF